MNIISKFCLKKYLGDEQMSNNLDWIFKTEIINISCHVKIYPFKAYLYFIINELKSNTNIIIICFGIIFVEL